jgi:hypothetical protein
MGQSACWRSPALDRQSARPGDQRRDLSRLRRWVESKPDVPEGDWYKDFGSFKICGQGSFPKMFLLCGQAARGKVV